ncbi:MAG TPA: protein kinase [Thermoanaerobaculia bacterium]|nr:protein kinase [Thermoanaerobaculia bacterium]
MGLPDESTSHENLSTTQVPTEREPVSPPDWPAESASFQPPAHYRILEALAGGGMGIVFKAEDTRLQRTVALKVLPYRLTNDPVAKARFLQEARAASALDHQNICTIYDVGETEDQRLYISMPWYEGETLRRRLARGPLPVEEALDFARQIARGLAKAHRQGIVHRDIKPENLMVTTEEVVKILDFGIAKLAGAADLTGTEHRIGTPAYMAPEQSRSGRVDHRADLWSLGVVLYEMVTGRRPFRGTNPVLVLQAIQYGVPEPISRLRHGVPARLEKIVARLLMKNPKTRYPDAESLLADLDGEGTGRRFRSARLAAGLVIVLGLGMAVSRLVEPGDSSQGGIGLVPSTIRQLTNQTGGEWYPSLAPDGQRFVYAKWDGSDYDLFLQDLDGGLPANLTDDFPGDDTHPAFSPDGLRIAFRSERTDGGGIFLMDLNGGAGGPASRLTDFGYSPAWSPDGRELLVATEGIADPNIRERASLIWRVDVATGSKRRVFDHDAVQPSWSPNGQRIAYWSVLPKDGRRVLWTIPAGGGRPVPVSLSRAVDWNPVWSSDGYLYFVSDRDGAMTPWRVEIDETTGLTLGDPQPLKARSRWAGFLSLSADGRQLLYATSETVTRLERAELDDRLAVSGPLKTLTGITTGLLHARVSPAGDRVVLADDVNDKKQEDLFLVPTDGSGSLVQLTRDEHRDRAPSWLRDGRIVFSSNRGGRYGLWTARPDGSAPRALGVSHQKPLLNPIPSPDGRWLACVLGLSGAALARGNQSPEPLPPVDGAPFVASSWSPDSRRLAGTVNGKPGIYLYSLAARRYERLTDSGWRPIWMPDGKKILFLDQGWKVAAVDLATRERQEVLAPEANSYFVDMDLDPARGLLYLVRQQSEGDIVMLDLE